MNVSEWVVHQIAHFSTTGLLMMCFARRVPIVFVLLGIFMGSGIKEFVFDRRSQDLQGRWEDFVFLALGGVVAALVIIYVPLY